MQAKFEQMNMVLPIEGIVTNAEATLVSPVCPSVCAGVRRLTLGSGRLGWRSVLVLVIVVAV